MNAIKTLPLCVLASFVLACASDDDAKPSSMANVASADFEARHDFTIDVPAGTRTLRAWFAMPSDSDPDQEMSHWVVEAPYPTRVTRDDRGNNFLLMEAENPAPGTVSVSTRFDLHRREVRASVD
ncbi:MAG: hypothetical protein KDB53_10070, partial [Planctomycetes bacterium]|nr:hypothetical protein [Planctomycetota bacterium]